MKENKTTRKRHSRLNIMIIAVAVLLSIHTIFSVVTCCIDAKQVFEIFSPSGSKMTIPLTVLFALCYLIPAFLSGFLVYKLVGSLLAKRQLSSSEATLNTGRTMILALLLLAVEIALIVVWCHPLSFPLRTISWCAALATSWESLPWKWFLYPL